MTRKEELAEVKSVIADNIYQASCGIYFTGNTVGDSAEIICTKDGESFPVPDGGIALWLG